MRWRGDALGASAITHILETRRRQRRQKPPIPLALPDRPGVRDLAVTPHPLEPFLLDVTGRQYAPPTDYPQFFYGFLAVTMAWQIAFLVIGLKPARFRLLMIPAMIEKLGYVATLAVLRGQARISAADAMPAWPDLLLGVLFIAAFAKTPPSGQSGN